MRWHKGTYSTENKKKIGAHKSYALSTIIKKGAELIYEK